MTSRSIATPTVAETRKASGSATASDHCWKLRRQRALDDEGRVGAEHHHLAVRHVDDAHDAEGDGQADRREQQHRSGGDAVDQVLQHVEPDEVRLDRRLGVERRGLDGRIVGLGGDLVDQALRVLVAARLQRRDGGDAIGARRLRRRGRRSPRAPDAAPRRPGGRSRARAARRARPARRRRGT